MNTTTLYGGIFEQCDKISVREPEVVDENSTTYGAPPDLTDSGSGLKNTKIWIQRDLDWISTASVSERTSLRQLVGNPLARGTDSEPQSRSWCAGPIVFWSGLNWTKPQT